MDNATPVLMRKARMAFAREDFATAEQIYASLLENPEVAKLLDVQMRHAMCVEKSGDLRRSIQVYERMLERYEAEGEVDAAKSLRARIGVLQELLQKQEMAALAEASIEDDIDTDDVFALDSQEVEPSTITMEMAREQAKTKKLEEAKAKAEEEKKAAARAKVIKLEKPKPEAMPSPLSVTEKALSESRRMQKAGLLFGSADTGEEAADDELLIEDAPKDDALMDVWRNRD